MTQDDDTGAHNHIVPLDASLVKISATYIQPGQMRTLHRKKVLTVVSKKKALASIQNFVSCFLWISSEQLYNRLLHEAVAPPRVGSSYVRVSAAMVLMF